MRDLAHYGLVGQRRKIHVLVRLGRDDDVVFFQQVVRDAGVERLFEHDVFGRQLQDRLDQIGVAQEAIAYQDVTDTLARDAALHDGGFDSLAVSKRLLDQVITDALIALQPIAGISSSMSLPFWKFAQENAMVVVNKALRDVDYVWDEHPPVK